MLRTVLGIFICIAAQSPSPDVDRMVETAAANAAARNRFAEHSRIAFRFSIHNPASGTAIPKLEAHLLQNGDKSRQRTFHLSPAAPTARAAERVDPLLNSVIVAGGRRVWYNEFSGLVEVAAAPVVPPRLFTLDDYWQKLFVPPFAAARHIEEPILVESGDNLRRTILQADLWLPEALRRPGWTWRMQSAQSPAISPTDWDFPEREILRGARRFANGVEDELWLDPAAGFHPLYRRIRFLPGDAYEVFFHRLEPVGGEGVVLARLLEWRRGDHVGMEELLEVARHPDEPGAYAFEPPPGALVVDQISGRRTEVPGMGGFLLEFQRALDAEISGRIGRWERRLRTWHRWIEIGAGATAGIGAWLLHQRRRRRSDDLQS